MIRGDKADDDPPKLGFRDLLAMALAALQTFLLPLIAIGVVIAVVAVILALTR